MSGIRVLVVDDQAIVRDGLVTVLALLPGIEVVGQASDGVEAIDAARELQPDVVLMDLRMPRLDGADATARIRADVPAARVVVLTTYDDDESIARALRAGAIGYLTKDAGRAELEAAVRSAATGQMTLAPAVGARLLGAGLAAPPRPALPSLTPREREVLDLVVAGRTNAEIAATLYLGVSTVKSHINAVFAKLGARDRAHAIAIALGTDG
ncbi:response regulator transcription factor [Galbitalea sp. SE-J8]|uniref:response regulator n=1 Tax=Galbitalea sp. SE-J8 TaxID=3054952 RepID=UPI00259CE9E2|nr:response regulator transcription factor [Galbitalea sp. SE-J8]MDM4764078.1 response regulator transcription factor [Galbitalea sp. SE-J8]